MVDDFLGGGIINATSGTVGGEGNGSSCFSAIAVSSTLSFARGERVREIGLCESRGDTSAGVDGWDVAGSLRLLGVMDIGRAFAINEARSCGNADRFPVDME